MPGPYYLDDDIRLGFVGVLRWRYRWPHIRFAAAALWNALCGYHLYPDKAPKTPEEIDAYLRDNGYDPDAVGQKMAAIAHAAMRARTGGLK